MPTYYRKSLKSRFKLKKLRSKMKNPNYRQDLIFWRRVRDYFMIPYGVATDQKIMRLRCAESFSFFINPLIMPAACCGNSSK
jgi:hypothetical protein